MSTRELIRYCDDGSARAAVGSALAVGMASRRLKFAIHGNEYELAAAGVPRLRQVAHDRYGVDLDDPRTTLDVAERRSALVVIHYFLGILALNHDGDPRAAVAQFEASAAVGAAQFRVYGLYPDPETPTYEFLSLAHRALALAQFDPDAVSAALAEMDDAVARRGAGDADLARDYRARAEHEVAVRRTRFGASRRRARAAAARGYRRMERSRVPGVSAVARGVRNVIQP